MFLISLKYKVPLESVEQHLPAHRTFLDTYYGQGKFLLSGRKVPRNGGVILAVGADIGEIEMIIKQDPFYVHEIAEYEITEIEPTQWDVRLNSLIGSKG